MHRVYKVFAVSSNITQFFITTFIGEIDEEKGKIPLKTLVDINEMSSINCSNLSWSLKNIKSSLKKVLQNFDLINRFVAIINLNHFYSFRLSSRGAMHVGK